MLISLTPFPGHELLAVVAKTNILDGSLSCPVARLCVFQDVSFFRLFECQDREPFLDRRK